MASSLSASQSSAVAKATPPSTATVPYFIPTVTPGVRNVTDPPYVLNKYGKTMVLPVYEHADILEVSTALWEFMPSVPMLCMLMAWRSMMYTSTNDRSSVHI